MLYNAGLLFSVTIFQLLIRNIQRQSQIEAVLEHSLVVIGCTALCEHYGVLLKKRHARGWSVFGE